MNDKKMQSTNDTRSPAPYWNPYVAGMFLGLTLLASFLILGAGLGASAGPARLGAFLEQCALPAHVAASDYFGHWVEEGQSLLSYYLALSLSQGDCSTRFGIRKPIKNNFQQVSRIFLISLV